MPKVSYTASKGLVQESGSGFEVSGVAIQPDIETLGRQVVQVAVLDGSTNGGGIGDGSGADVNGLYFSFYDHTDKITVWFTVDGEGDADPVSQPSVDGTNRYIKVEVADGDAVAAVGGAAVSAIDEVSTVDAVDGGDGSFTIEGATPYEAAGEADNGNMDGAVTQTEAGSGASDSTFALETHGVSVLSLDNLDLFNAATAFTLADGAHVGAMKVITRDDTHNTDQTLTCTGYLANDTTLAPRTFTFGGDTDTDSRTVVLCWDGNGWVIMKLGAGVSVA